jgi:2-polyprenyl-3-methyl-5-hydroxy-6-metoxy-1,4-benzoquinol methylase
MAERAHPDDPGFQEPWRLRLRRGWIPWLEKRVNPYRQAVIWRYGWADGFCRGKRVLDIPCGMGWGTSLIRSAATVCGMDIQPEAVAEARRRYGKRIRFETGSMADLAFADGSFDVVTCLEGIEHVPVEVGRAFLRESHRVLAPGGVLLLSSPYCRDRAHSGNAYHLHEYRPEEIQQELQPFYTIEDRVERNVDIMSILYIRGARRD